MALNTAADIKRRKRRVVPFALPNAATGHNTTTNDDEEEKERSSRVFFLGTVHHSSIES